MGETDQMLILHVPFHVVVVVGGGGGAGTPFMPGCYEYFFIALGLGLVFMASDLFFGRNLLFFFSVSCEGDSNRILDKRSARKIG